MRSYADTLSGTKPQGGASATSACFKFTAVMVGLLLIAGAVFVGIKFLPDDDVSANGSGSGAFPSVLRCADRRLSLSSKRAAARSR